MLPYTAAHQHFNTLTKARKHSQTHTQVPWIASWLPVQARYAGYTTATAPSGIFGVICDARCSSSYLSHFIWKDTIAEAAPVPRHFGAFILASVLGLLNLVADGWGGLPRVAGEVRRARARARARARGA